MAEHVRNTNILSNLPIPDMFLPQIEAFTFGSLLARTTGKLDPLHAAHVLQQNSGSDEVLVFDIGGTAIKSAVVKAINGKIYIGAQCVTESREKGGGYLDALIQARREYPNLPTAVSTSGVVEAGKLEACPNLNNFVEQLKKAGSFSTVLGEDTLIMNDAQAGLIAGTVGVTQRDLQAGTPTRPNTIYIINGGGIGGAMMDKDGILRAAEPGHVELLSELNPNGVEKACGLKGNQYTCIERVGASGAGIEEQWEKRFEQRLDGKSIAEMMYSGNEYALNLYKVASTATAHIVAGMIRAMGILPSEVSVVLHGGFFNTEGVIERMKRILNRYYEQNIDLTPTKNLGYPNACMAGAAIAALTSNR